MDTVGFYLLDLGVTTLITFGALAGVWVLLAVVGTIGSNKRGDDDE